MDYGCADCLQHLFEITNSDLFDNLFTNKTKGFALRQDGKISSLALLLCKVTSNCLQHVKTKRYRFFLV